MQVQAELGDGSELDGEAKERKQRVGLVPPLFLVRAAKVTASEHRPFRAELYACNMEVDLALAKQLTHAIDAVLSGTKPVAMVHQASDAPRPARD